MVANTASGEGETDEETSLPASSTFPLLAEGTLTYNGFTFPPAVHLSVQASPVTDSTGRNTKFVAYLIQAEMILYPGVDAIDAAGVVVEEPTFPALVGGTDFGMQHLRRLLTEQQKPLLFQGKGFGTLKIDTNSSDIAHGPKPRVLQWEPVGSNNAVRVVWAVEVAVSECGIVLSAGARPITEFAYEVDYSIDNGGFTTVTYAGVIEIASKLLANGAQALTADAFRGALRIALPNGFTRSQKYSLSADGRSLKFRVTDREIESEIPYHTGIVDASVSHTISSAGSLVGTTWMVSLDGSFKVGAGFDKGRAWAAFLAIVKTRRDAAKRHALLAKTGSDRNTPGTKPNPHAMLMKLSITDEVFGRGMKFSIAWMVWSSFDTILRAGGLFADSTPRTDWNRYKSSMLKEAWSPRGYAQLRLRNQNAIGDPCKGFPLNIYTSSNIHRQRATVRLFTAECPPKSASYLYYSSAVELITDHKTISLHASGGIDKYDPHGPDGEGGTYKSREPTSSGDKSRGLIVHTQGPARFRVRFTGAATRAGFKIPEIELIKYGGADVSRPLGKGSFKQKSSGVGEDCRIYQAVWDKTYELYSAPDGDLIETDPDITEFQR